MKKSFVAMVLILVLCLSQFMIGNAEGKAVDLAGKFVVNDEGSFTLEEVDGGTKITATEAKGEWSFVKADIEGNVKEYTQVRLVVEGTQGVQILLKLEGTNGNPQGVAVKEQWVDLTGEEQEIIWEVAAENLTDNGNEMFMIFLNAGGGKTGCNAENPEYVTVKSVKLCTPDYVEPEVEEPSIDDTADINTAPLFAVLVLGLAVVAFASKKRFAR